MQRFCRGFDEIICATRLALRETHGIRQTDPVAPFQQKGRDTNPTPPKWTISETSPALSG